MSIQCRPGVFGGGDIDNHSQDQMCLNLNKIVKEEDDAKRQQIVTIRTHLQSAT